MSEFECKIANLMRARFPLIYVPTWEEERLVEKVREIAENESLIKTKRNVLTWTSAAGFEGDNKQVKEESPLATLEFISRYKDPAIFILKDFHVFFGAGNNARSDFNVIRKIRNLSYELKHSPEPKNVIFVSPQLVLPNELQKDITIVDFELPTAEEINEILNKTIEANKNNTRITINLNETEKEQLVKSALGLTLNEAENAFARALVNDGKLSIQDIDIILEEKKQIIKKSDILEFIQDDNRIEDIGGLENLKRWLKKRDKSWSASAKKYSLPAPKGILITGVPGCGKSLTAKAISSMWKLPLLRLDVGKIYRGIVGGSEENIRLAIKTAEAIAPSILWIDEIEKGFNISNNAGDSGTSARVFSTFLTWMQEKTKPVFVIATANNISFLPPELLRKGRFDEIFFVDLPTSRERVEIFKVHLAKRLKEPEIIGDFTLTEGVLSKLANMTEGFTGSEIEQVIIDGLFEAFSEDRKVNLTDFTKVISNTIPLSVVQSEQIRSIREWANVRAVAATIREDSEGYGENVKKEAPKGICKDDVTGDRGGRRIDF